MNRIEIEPVLFQIIEKEKHALESNLDRKVTTSEALRSLLKFGLRYDDYKLLETNDRQNS
jgi:hypothetical protein